MALFGSQTRFFNGGDTMSPTPNGDEEPLTLKPRTQLPIPGTPSEPEVDGGDGIIILPPPEPDLTEKNFPDLFPQGDGEPSLDDVSKDTGGDNVGTPDTVPVGAVELKLPEGFDFKTFAIAGAVVLGVIVLANLAAKGRA